MNEFKARLSDTALQIENALTQVLDDRLLDGEIARPEKLMKAMRHGALNGGKRLRPFLVIETAKLFDVDDVCALRVGLALECVHCYSLIHDDLPAMDDDDMRRGKPTVHKAYDEATAILAGDGLLTLAFDILADRQTHKDPAIRAELCLQLARSAGSGGMVGGQVLDIAAEIETPDQAGISNLQAMKTGALLRFACEAGAILGQASSEQRENMREFGGKIGQAFQLADDILDVTASSEAMGKRTAKDSEKGKGTLVALWGLQKAREHGQKLVLEAEELLNPFGEKGNVLKACARFIMDRET